MNTGTHLFRAVCQSLGELTTRRQASFKFERDYVASNRRSIDDPELHLGRCSLDWNPVRSSSVLADPLILYDAALNGRCAWSGDRTGVPKYSLHLEIREDRLNWKHGAPVELYQWSASKRVINDDVQLSTEFDRPGIVSDPFPWTV